MSARLLTASLVLAIVVPHAAVAERRSSIYVEALGKGGLWGLGWDHQLSRRFSIGMVGSAWSLEDQHYVSLSPYVGFYIARRGRSAWFADVGAQLAHVWYDSPVPEWDGDSSTGIGGIFSTGYEFRARVMFRLFAHGVIGKGGALPWAGTGIGWAF